MRDSRPQTRTTYATSYDPWSSPAYAKVSHGKPGFRFSQRELKEIGITILVLTAAFTIVLSHRTSVFLAFLTAAGAVMFGFFLHEMGHKLTAQRYGCWAEYRVWNMGLLMALLTSMAGFLFAAPGAVHISGAVDRRRNGIISIAGPMTNLAAGSAFLVMALLLPLSSGAVFVFSGIAMLNIFLGTFNMLPVPPLDGSKVLKWDPKIYGLTMGVFIFLFLLFVL